MTRLCYVMLCYSVLPRPSARRTWDSFSAALLLTNLNHFSIYIGLYSDLFKSWNTISTLRRLDSRLNLMHSGVMHFEQYSRGSHIRRMNKIWSHCLFISHSLMGSLTEEVSQLFLYGRQNKHGNLTLGRTCHTYDHYMERQPIGISGTQSLHCIGL